MKKIAFRKFFSDTTLFFILITTSITLIVWVIQAVNYLDFVTEDGHSFKIYFFYTLYSFPKIFSRVFPFLFFISLFYIILRYEENNELVIFWINGIKKIEFINHIIRYSVIFLVIQISLTTFIVPKSQDLARSHIRYSNIDFFPSLIKEKKFIDTVSNLTIFIDSKDDKGKLKKIFLKDKINSLKSQIIYAKEGELIKTNNQNFLILFDGEMINIDKGKTTIFSFKKTRFNLSKYSTKTTTFPKIQELQTGLLTKCIYHVYKNKSESFNSRTLSCEKKNIKPINQEFLKRTYKPMYLIIIAFITSLLVLKSKDDENYYKFKTLIFTACVILIIFSEICIRYVGFSIVGNILFLITPIIISLIGYSLLINKVKTF